MACAGLTLEELQGIDPDVLTPMFQEQLRLTERDAVFHEMAIWQDSATGRLEHTHKTQRELDRSHTLAQAQTEHSQACGLTPPFCWLRSGRYTIYSGLFWL